MTALLAVMSFDFNDIFACSNSLSLLVALVRLASFICGYELFQISVSSSYGVTEFKENLLTLYTKVCVLPDVLSCCK